MSKIVNFHIPAGDVDRAATFYGKVFGWTFARVAGSETPYLVHEPGGDSSAGIPAAICERQATVKHPVPTIDVAHADRAMLDIATSGGQAGHVAEIPGIGRFGYAIDSEGNVIAILQREAT